MGLKISDNKHEEHKNESVFTPKTPVGSFHEIDAGLDCSVTLLKHGLALVQTTDFFYPLIDDPYLMGKITCANVLSDLYAMGVVHCDNMLMIIGIPESMEEKDQVEVIPLIMKGFKDLANIAGSIVTGGETNLSACSIIGGTATSVCKEEEILMPDRACSGDAIVLTKPLGTQAATMVFSWLENSDKWKLLETVITRDEALLAYETAVKSMTRLNRSAAILMHEFNAHAATDITGFGLLGHAKNLARHQKNDISFKIHTIPIISKMKDVNTLFNNQFHLTDGKGIETSGGLFICLPSDSAKDFCTKFKEIEGCDAWIIGEVIDGEKGAFIVETPSVIEVS